MLTRKKFIQRRTPLRNKRPVASYGIRVDALGDRIEIPLGAIKTRSSTLAPDPKGKIVCREPAPGMATRYRFARKKAPRSISKERRVERVDYNERKAIYLDAHPFDQIQIAELRFDEAEVIARGGVGYVNGNPIFIRRSDQIHHRLKCHGERLCDERWWMATSLPSHEKVERNKRWARNVGFLLPIQADSDGRWGAGNQAVTTPELMRLKARKETVLWGFNCQGQARPHVTIPSE